MRRVLQLTFWLPELPCRRAAAAFGYPGLDDDLAVFQMRVFRTTRRRWRSLGDRSGDTHLRRLELLSVDDGSFVAVGSRPSETAQGTDDDHVPGRNEATAYVYVTEDHEIPLVRDLLAGAHGPANHLGLIASRGLRVGSRPDAGESERREAPHGLTDSCDEFRRNGVIGDFHGNMGVAEESGGALEALDDFRDHGLGVRAGSDDETHATTPALQLDQNAAPPAPYSVRTGSNPAKGAEGSCVETATT